MRGLSLVFVRPSWRCTQPGSGTILSALQTCGVVTVIVIISYKGKAEGPNEVNLARISARKVWEDSAHSSMSVIRKTVQVHE